MFDFPKEFALKMEKLLGEREYREFAASFQRERRPALRINTIRIGIEDFLRISPFSLSAVPWTSDGFYYDPAERPGKHPYHEAGLYYIQEPSAMAVGELAAAKPGERVLDLCAAPGGKTAKLAASMAGRGLLVSNEIHPLRAKILAQNVERMGIPHAVVTNEAPEALAAAFRSFFDCVVVDAPCSGEGMFRKEEQALLQWNQENVEFCGARQRKILEQAVQMLRPGGRLLYSTCTFSPEENEGSVGWLLREYPEFHVERQEAYKDFTPGRPEWADAPEEVENTLRLWPHKLEGEGHYAAVLCRSSDAQKEHKITKKYYFKAADRASVESWREFEKENLGCCLQGVFLLFGEQLYLLPEELPLKGLKVLRAGLHLGTLKKSRFEPAQALAMALKAEEAKRTLNLPVFSGKAADAAAYLRGETLPCEGEKGWTLVLTEGYSLGWGKVSGGVLKNHYPKGLRRN